MLVWICLHELESNLWKSSGLPLLTIIFIHVSLFCPSSIPGLSFNDSLQVQRQLEVPECPYNSALYVLSYEMITYDHILFYTHLILCSMYYTPCQFTEAWNHTIRECFRLEGTFRGHLAQLPCSEQGHLQLNQVAQSLVQTGLEYFQGCGLWATCVKFSPPSV